VTFYHSFQRLNPISQMQILSIQWNGQDDHLIDTKKGQ
jgi:hypothetical protein